MLAKRGAIGRWLWEEFQAYYFRSVKPLRVNDFSKPWVIWDNITLAYVLGMTTQHTMPRPRLRDDMTFEQAKTDQTITWITDVDEQRMWADFLRLVDEYQRTHAVGRRRSQELGVESQESEARRVASRNRSGKTIHEMTRSNSN